jgi:hypothetical protein
VVKTISRKDLTILDTMIEAAQIMEARPKLTGEETVSNFFKSNPIQRLTSVVCVSCTASSVQLVPQCKLIITCQLLLLMAHSVLLCAAAVSCRTLGSPEVPGGGSNCSLRSIGHD